MKCFHQVLIFIILALVLGPATRGQVIEEKLFRIVPNEQKTNLINRLKLYLEYKRASQPDKLREFYDNVTLCSLCKGQLEVDCEDKGQQDNSKCLKCQQDICKDDQECVKDCRALRVATLVGSPLHSETLELRVRSVELIKGKALKYKIVLDSKSRLTIGEESQIVKEKATLKATLQNGEWYFSRVVLE